MAIMFQKRTYTDLDIDSVNEILSGSRLQILASIIPYNPS